MDFRPSLLPKLAACPAYRPEEFAGAAADRGTSMDVVFREANCGLPDRSTALTNDANAAVGWAVETVRILAGENALEAREPQLVIGQSRRAVSSEGAEEEGEKASPIPTP
jgi:hypothetical protein